MSFWHATHFQHVTNGRWLQPPLDENALNITGVSIDTRTLQPGQAYIAIIGEQLDGHAYVQAAHDAGAVLYIVSRDDITLPEGAAVLQVDDTVVALQKLAADYRNHLRNAGCKVITVSGSNGKTTTRHLIHQLLASSLVGSQSPKSFNNHIGVPLTLLAAKLQPTCDHYVVVEIGTNHPGEVDALAKIAMPDIAVVTAVGREHMAFFGSLENVAHEEAAIAKHIATQGTIIAHTSVAQTMHDANLIAPGPGAPTVNLHTFETADIQHITHTDQGYDFTFDANAYHLPLLGKHNLDNAIAAIITAKKMNVAPNMIRDALKSVTAMPMRMQRIACGQITFINDAYNANPDSMIAAIDTLATYPTTGRHLLILGDMLELGDHARNYHQQIGEHIVTKYPGVFSHVFCIGELAQAIAQVLHQHKQPMTCEPTWRDALPHEIISKLKAHDVALIKASRSMKLERLIPGVK